MNIVEIAGHLGADPEVRFSASGQKIISMRVATNVRRQGKEETIWWRVTIFGDRFDKMLTYMKKGSSIIVIGEMNPPHIWTDKEGKQHVQLEIVAEMIRFSPFGKERSPEGGASAGYSQSQGHANYSQTGQAANSPYTQSNQRSSSANEGAMAYSEPSYGAAGNGQYNDNQFSPSFNNHDDENVPF